MITLDEIIKKSIAVHCDTEEKANVLLKALHKKGIKWASNIRLTYANMWDAEKENTCYRIVNINNNKFCTYSDGRLMICKRCEFEDIDFDENQPLKPKQLRKMIGKSVWDNKKNQQGKIISVSYVCDAITIYYTGSKISVHATYEKGRFYRKNPNK